MKNWWRSRSIQSKRSKEIELTHWEANYALQDPGNLALFEEYLEMGKARIEILYYIIPLSSPCPIVSTYKKNGSK